VKRDLQAEEEHLYLREHCGAAIVWPVAAVVVVAVKAPRFPHPGWAHGEAVDY